MLIAGVFWGPWFALTRSLNLFSPAEFIKITKTLSHNLGAPMRILLPACIVLMSVSVYLFPGKSSLRFIAGIVSIISIVASLIITVAIEVPIVKKIELWTADNYPADWTEFRDRWLKFHIYRMLAAFISFCCLAMAVLQR
ncbi:hypothetical protein GCM10022210_08520 [Mucilaginibacter dorajii]|uniref:DUF1772 domain-containing protein n=2 Tax=Mucilaginibacter dorajii TaxID=692994 RepID=A0ABP7PBD9_9SPHI